MKAVAKTLDEIRSAACDSILVVSTVLVFFAVAGSLARMVDYGWHPLMALHISLFAALVVTTLGRRHLSLAVRAGVITIVPYLATVGGLLTYGRGTGVGVFFVSTCVLAACFFSRRIALAVAALCLATLCAIYAGALSDVLTFAANPIVFDNTVISWFAYATSLAAATIGPLIAISALLHHMEAERRRADEAAQARSDFLARMSHELRTPMAGIMGMAEVLGHTRVDTRQQNMITNLMRASRSLLGTLNDLLDFSTFEAGTVQLDTQPFLMSEIVYKACALFEVRAAQKNVGFQVDVSPSLNDVVMGDGFRLGQVVGNLVDNAIKFTERGTVRVSAQRTPSAKGTIFTCAVSDTGIGMTDADIARVFDPFEQADTSISRTHGGSGLGLAICRHLVEAMGGTIKAHARPGAGATFTITIPFAAVPEITVAAPAKPAPAPVFDPTRGPSLHLLVVDDDRDMRTLAEIMLPRFGHQVTLVADGDAALKAARDARFDCILMDMHMPGMNGLEAMHAIHAAEGRTRRTPMIALTADVVSEHVRVFMEAGADVVVAKPVDWHLLETKLRHITKPRVAAE